MASQARAKRVSTAMRRVVVTPTFAASLGVVLAAVLAYPMTRTVFSYGRPGGHPCATQGCATSEPNAGSPASAAPGAHLMTPSPPAARSASGERVLMRYQTVRTWQGGFAGKITIIPRGQASATWRIRIVYASAQILHVWGGDWLYRGDHVAIVGATKHFSPGGAAIVISVAATGSPAPPSGCFYNNLACRAG